eukprot:6481453-Prymnesium_polylepis.1
MSGAHVILHQRRLCQQQDQTQRRTTADIGWADSGFPDKHRHLRVNNNTGPTVTLTPAHVRSTLWLNPNLHRLAADTVAPSSPPSALPGTHLLPSPPA